MGSGKGIEGTETFNKWMIQEWNGINRGGCNWDRECIGSCSMTKISIKTIISGLQKNNRCERQSLRKLKLMIR